MEGNPAERFFEFLDADPAEGRFFWTGGPVEVAERTWFQSQGSGVTAFDTDEGLVLVDAGTVFFGQVLAGALGFLIALQMAAPRGGP